MKIVFDFNEKKCSACGACAVACMDQNDVDVRGGQRPYRRVEQYERRGEFVRISIACLHCPEAPCAEACPAGCLYPDGDTGLVRYDTAACIGCRACAAVCPCDALSFRPTDGGERMEKCHGCLERIEAALSPACVRACPTGALTWRRAEETARSSLAALYDRWRGADRLL